jgi:hypothetical protein
VPYRMPPSRGFYALPRTALLSRSNLYNPLRDFLADYAKRDRPQFLNDFKDRNEVNNWTMAQTQTSVNFTAANDAVGVLAATAVATTTASVSMITKDPYIGNANVLFEGRFKVNTVATNFIMEFGLVDAAPATGASFVTDIDVPSFAGTNGAVFGIWTNQTHTSIAFASVGSFTSQTVASTLITAATAGFTTPVADTYITATLALLTDPDETGKTKAYCWVNGVLRAKHEVAAGAVNGQSSLFGWFYVQAVSAAAKIATIDYVYGSQDRVALQAGLE